MALYRISGTSKEAGASAPNLVIAFKGDRASPGTMGEELGRVMSTSGGSWEILFEDWSLACFVICVDSSSSLKYQAKVRDWHLATLIDTEEFFPVVLDHHFPVVRSLLHLDGADAATVFTDVVAGNVWSAVSGAALITAQQKFGTASLDLNGTTDLISNTNYAAFDLVDLRFCLEVQAYPDTAIPDSTTHGLMGSWGGAAGRSYYLSYQRSGASYSLVLSYSTDGTAQTDITFTLSSALTVSAWNSIAIDRDVDTLRCFVAGVQEGGDQALSGLVFAPTQNFLLGAVYDGTSNTKFFPGHLDELRVTVGASRYQAGYIEAVAAYADTQFEVDKEATILDPYFRDVAILNHFEIDLHDEIPGINWTAVGTGGKTKPVIGADRGTPFFKGLYLTGNASQGQGYTTQDLPAFGTKDFTVEFTSTFPGTSGPIFRFPIDFRSAPVVGDNWGLVVDSYATSLKFETGTSRTGRIFGGTNVLGGGHHQIAVSRKNGTTYLFVDGILQGAPYVDSSDYLPCRLFFGGFYAALTWPVNGFMDELRITMNVGRYDSNYVPASDPFPNFEYDTTELLAPEVPPTALLYPEEADPFYESVYSLLHFDAEDGSTEFHDEFSREWTGVNQAVISDTRGRFGPTSLRLDGTADYLTYGTAADWQWLHDGTVDYTIDFWLYRDAASDDNLLDTGGAATAAHGIYLKARADGTLDFIIAKGTGGTYSTRATSGTGIVPTTQWTHIAVTVIGGGLATLYVDGVFVASGTSVGNSSSAPDYTLRVGYYAGAGGNDLAGNIDEFRITQAIRYSTNFTAPVASAPDWRFTKNREATILDPYYDSVELLLHLDELTFADTSSNVSTVTLNGTVDLDGTTKKFGASSAGFDASGDYLSLPDSAIFDLGTSDFTLEGWWRIPNTTSPYAMIARRTTGLVGWALGMQNTGAVFFRAKVGGSWSDTFLDSGAGTMTATEWVHLAVTRSGSNWFLFIDGVLMDSVSNAGALDDAGGTVEVGRASNANEWQMIGNIDDIRLTRGVARYTKDFPCPVEAFPDVEYDTVESLPKSLPAELDPYFDKVTCLLHFEGNTKDVTGRKNTLYSGASVGATSAIEGAGELVTNSGSSARLEIDNPDGGLTFGTEDFTIELSFIMPTVVQYVFLLDTRPFNTSGNYPLVYMDTVGDKVAFNTLRSSATPTVGSRVDVAVVRKTGVMYLFVNGALQGSGVNTIDYLSETVVNLGSSGYDESVAKTAALIDEVRITKGVGRYTEAYTPSFPLPDRKFVDGREPTLTPPADVLSLLHFDDGLLTDAVGLEWDSSTAVIIETSPFFGTGMLDCSGGGNINCFDPSLALGTGDFTIEGFFSFPAGAGYAFLFDARSNALLDVGPALYAGPSATTLWFASAGTNHITGTANVRDGLEHHFAVSRVSGTTRLFFDGVQDGGNFIDANDYIIGDLGFMLGASSQVNAGYPSNGKFDGLRISSVGLYATGFTVPAEAYPSYEYDPLELLPANFPTVLKDEYFDKVLFKTAGTGLHGSTTITSEVGDFTDEATLSYSNLKSKFYNTSLLFDGTAYLDVPFALSGSWTIEFWMNANSLTAYTILDNRISTGVQVALYGGTGTGLILWVTGVNRITGIDPLLDGWQHIALTCDGTTMELFQAGKSQGTYVTAALTSTDIRVGEGHLNDQPVDVHMQDIRMTYAVRYAGDFCPPAEPHPSSKFLKGTEPEYTDPHYASVGSMVKFEGEAGANVFTDEISGVTWAAQGNATTEAGGKFGTRGDFTTAGGQGSGGDHRLLGTGVPDIGTGDFTVELWVQSTVQYNDFRQALDTRVLGTPALTNCLIMGISLNASTLSTQIGNTALTSAVLTMHDSNWHHYAVTRSGTDVKVWWDGVLVNSGTSSANILIDTGLNLGCNSSEAHPFRGYLDDFRWTVGVARYSENFVPPVRSYPESLSDALEPAGDYLSTEVVPALRPLSVGDFSKVVSILHFNGGHTTTVATDEIPGVTWSMLTGAQINNSFAKFGKTSALVTTSDKIISTDIKKFIGTGDFTIEGWIYGGANASVRIFFDFRETNGDVNGGVVYYNNSGGLLYHTSNATQITGTTDPFNSTWRHVALCRVLGVTRLFLDGVQEGADYADPAHYRVGATGYCWGNQPHAGGDSDLNGYLDECRITVGLGRYSETFTVPDRAFPHRDEVFVTGRSPTTLDYTFDANMFLTHFNQEYGYGGGAVDVLSRKTLTLQGTAYLDKTQCRFGESSLYVPTASRMEIVNTDMPLLLDADFTVEMWYRPSGSAESTGQLYQSKDGSSFAGLTISHNGASQTQLLVNSVKEATPTTWETGITAGALVADKWHHIAVTRAGSTITLWIDGVSAGTDTVAGELLYGPAGTTVIGGITGARAVLGNIDDLRISAEAKYTAAFLPPETPHPEFEYDVDELL